MSVWRRIEKEGKRIGKRLEKDVQNLRDNLVEKAMKPLKDPPTVPRNKNPNKLFPGVAIIFNNQNFEDPAMSRKGSEKDVERLKESFEKYSILTLVVQDLTADEIRETIEKG